VTRSDAELRAIIPILPSRDLVKTRAFYEQLGFATRGWWPEEFGGYAILLRDGIELHFTPMSELIPSENDSACYWRVRDVAAIHAQCRALVAAGDGIPRVSALEDRPWGMREFALVDPEGNLVRIGEERR